MTSNNNVPIHPAATLILLRPTQDNSNIEVLLLLRAKEIKFAGGNWVFPGGRIESKELDDAGQADLSSAKIAATRETCEEAGFNIGVDDLHYYSHWTTPPSYPKRFSTWFLLGSVDRKQAITVDQGEIVEYRWLTPATALAQHQRGDLTIMPPTYVTLLELSNCASIAEAIEFTNGRNVPQIVPNSFKHQGRLITLYSEDSGYETSELDLPGPRHRIVETPQGWQYERDF